MFLPLFDQPCFVLLMFHLSLIEQTELELKVHYVWTSVEGVRLILIPYPLKLHISHR